MMFLFCAKACGIFKRVTHADRLPPLRNKDIRPIFFALRPSSRAIFKQFAADSKEKLSFPCNSSENCLFFLTSMVYFAVGMV
jgi:hypothetical protein